jgi:hypothetical protein
MSATIRLTVVIPVEGEAQVSFLDGPDKGVWQTLCQKFSRLSLCKKVRVVRRGTPKPCSYIASVEFRQVGKPINVQNNFLRVTVEDERHTIVEVKPTVPTVNY